MDVSILSNGTGKPFSMCSEADDDFKYLTQGLVLKLVKQKWIYPYEHMGSFKKLSEDKLPDRCEFF